MMLILMPKTSRKKVTVTPNLSCLAVSYLFHTGVPPPSQYTINTLLIHYIYTINTLIIYF